MPFCKITFTTTIKRAAPKQVTVPTAKGSADQSTSPSQSTGPLYLLPASGSIQSLWTSGVYADRKHFAYLIQRCKDGFVVREFQADRTYGKESLPNSKLYCQEIRRTIYDRERKPRTYYWGLYKQRNMRWISGSPVLIVGLVRMMDGFMAKHCQLWNSRNFDAQGSSTGFGSRKALIRKNIWLCSNGYLKWNRSAR